MTSFDPNLITQAFSEFLQGYDVEAKDEVWRQQSSLFRSFWSSRVMASSSRPLLDSEIDEVVRILDRNGKGNTKATEAVARAMIPQGAWRRMFNDLKNDPKLSKSLDAALTAGGPIQRASSIDKLYELNAKNKNNLTGKSANAISSMLAAWDPWANLSVISLNDRRRILEQFQFELPEFGSLTLGNQIVSTNHRILAGFSDLGVKGSARTLSVFLYSPTFKPVWKPEEKTQPGESGGPTEDQLSPGAQKGTERTDTGLFYLEEELENFLIRNWDYTELGKKYELIKEEGEMVSQQYPTPIGIIDILVQDKKNKQYVVIELKRDQTSDQTVGQLARYMGWLEENRTKGQPTKGIIIAGKYDIRLYYALKVLRDAEVYLYQVDFKLTEFKQ